MSDGVNEKSGETNDAEVVDRTWNPGGAGNELGDRSDTSDATWNPGGVGNATEAENPDEKDEDAEADEAEAAGE